MKEKESEKRKEKEKTQGFLSALNANVRQLNEASEFVKEFQRNAKIVEKALELFAAQVMRMLFSPLFSSFFLFFSLLFFFFIKRISLMCYLKAPNLFVEACSNSSITCD